MLAKKPKTNKAHTLTKETLKIKEDMVLSMFAENREQTFCKTKALTHGKAWQPRFVNGRIEKRGM